MMFLTFALAVIWNVEVGIIVSVTLSLLIIVRRSSKTHIKILVCRDFLWGSLNSRLKLASKQGHVPNTERWQPVDEDEDNRVEIPGVLIVKLRDDLDFGT